MYEIMWINISSARSRGARPDDLWRPLLQDLQFYALFPINQAVRETENAQKGSDHEHMVWKTDLGFNSSW